MKNLAESVVVITGASAGVGRATAVEFGKSGATVVLLARNKESLAGAKQETEKAGGTAYYFSVDVADEKQVDTIVQEIEETIGPVDIWINNAMNSIFSPIKQMLPLEYKRVTEVTYLGQVYGTLAALKYMLPRDSGKIIFVGSALAYRGIPLQSAYCGAKHAIQGFFDSLRAELLHDKSNVKIAMVQLPALNTTQFGWVKSRLPNKPKPMGKIYQPEVAARGIKYAATHNLRELFIGYPTYQAIIGNKLLPGYIDRVLAKSGFKGQQTDEPKDSDRKHNLWKPVPGNHSAHGVFDDQAHKKSFTLWLAMRRGGVWMSVFILVVVIVLILIF